MPAEQQPPSESSAIGRHWQTQAPVVPADIKLKREQQELILSWPDGQLSTYTAATLRRNCPCASCRTDRQQQADNPLHILANVPDQEPQMSGAELMGNYAIKIIWSDGHDTGIFDYRYLRTLDAIS